jgi:hypothetical protein
VPSTRHVVDGPYFITSMGCPAICRAAPSRWPVSKALPLDLCDTAFSPVDNGRLPIPLLDGNTYIPQVAVVLYLPYSWSMPTLTD